LIELLSIIVPVYNEVRTVRAVLDRLVSIDLPVERELLVVDDGSTDGTAEALAQALVDGLPIQLIQATRNGGKGAAIRLGLARASGTIIAIQDADLELDPQQIGELVAPVLAGVADVVYGSRFLSGPVAAPRLAVAANRLLTAVTNILYGCWLTVLETC
jgi:glycosyltransferase involved in cell wall biosynthesis